jgi:hypothetical protein
MSDRPAPENVQQTADIKDIQSGRDTIIGDINKTINQYIQQQNDWVERESLEEYKSPYFPSPIKIELLLKQILNQRLLVLGGDHEDKSDLALHLAVKLRDLLLAHSGESNISIWEWNSISNTQSLFAGIRREGIQEINRNRKAPAILFLPEIQPQHNLNQISQAAVTGNSYVIATAKTPVDKWAVTDNQRRSFCWEPSIKQPLYKSEDLGTVIVHRLNDRTKTQLSREVALYLQQLVAEQLQTFVRVTDCIQLLGTEQKALSRETVLKAVENAQRGREINLKEWFRNLEPREQLLALGLNLFDGLFEDQFFAALEQVVRNVWQQRDSTLRALDYCDLENLGNYFEFSKITAYDYHSNNFKFVKTDDGAIEIEISRIEIRNPNDRRLLFKIAWDTHRRQIINGLSEIVQIVKESVKKEPDNWELYGNLIRRNHLHSTIAQTLSDIGLVSTSAIAAVKDTLLQLASHPTFEVRNVAAIALARWYLDGRERELFATLRQFWSIAVETKSDSQETEEWQNYIGSTVAMTISYAAVNATKNKFLKEFINWVKELSESKNLIVRAYFGYHTLSYLVPGHLLDMEATLREIAQNHSDLNDAIAHSLALAYTVRPNEVQNILDSWYQQSSKNLSAPNNNAAAEIKFGRLMATVALTYGELEYDN